MLDSYWSDLGPELLTEILVLLPFRDRLVCEKTCKSWHCTLSCATQPNVWGYTWTLFNARSGGQQQLLNLNHDHFMAHIPEPSHKHNFVSWALCRIKTVSHIYLGHPNNPVDLLTDSSANSVVCELLTQLNEQDKLKQPELSVSVAGSPIATGFYVAAPIFDLLPSLCTSITLGPGLTSVEVGDLTRLTRLTHLELRFNRGYRPLKLMPMDELTQLRELESLKLYFPPKLPAWMDHFVWLESLTLAPRTNATVDLTQCQQLTYLCISPCGEVLVPVILPNGTGNHLQSLAVHAPCEFQHLADAQDLTRLELSLYDSVVSKMTWPAELASLSVIEMCMHDEYYCGSSDRYDYSSRYFRAKGLRGLPDAWQNYTNLMCLKLPFFYGHSLPDWFSQLQKLRRIHMPEAEFEYFPSAFPSYSSCSTLSWTRLRASFYQTL